MTYQVHIDDVLREASLEDLEALVLAGKVIAVTRVRPVGGAWVAAGTLAALRHHFVVDAWSAWEDEDDEDDEDDEEGVKEATAEESTPEELEDPPTDPVARPAFTLSARPRPVQPVVPIEPVAFEGPDELDELDTASVEFVEPLGVPVLPPEQGPGMGELIDFPGPAPVRRRRTGQAALARQIEPMREPATVPATIRIPGRWFVLAGVVLATAALVIGGSMYVNHEAGWVSTTPVQPIEPPPVALVEVVPPEPEPDTDKEMDDLERELRQAMSPGIEEVCGGEVNRVEDVLFLELQRLVSVSSIRVDVVSWSPTQCPTPDILELRVRLNDRGELVRDLGAVALVVGKYTLHHEWQVRELDVQLLGNDGRRGRELDPQKTVDFWDNTIGFRELLLEE